MSPYGSPRLGRIRIPPLPKETVLTDRSDGKTYKVVKDNGTPGLSEVTVNRKKHWVYAAFEGPTVEDDDGNLKRLFASSGSLDFETSDRNVRHAPVDVIVSSRPIDVWRVAIESGALTLNQVDL